MDLASSPMTADDSERVMVSAGTLELMELVEEGLVTRVDFFDNGHTAVVDLPPEGEAGELRELVVELPGTGVTPELLGKLNRQKITINVHSNRHIKLSNLEWALLIAIQFSIPLFLTGTILWVVGERLTSRGRLKREVLLTPKTGVTLRDVAGVDEARESMREVIDFLRAPESFLRVGAKIPRGVVLSGPPGTGKTLMAKALAGEAGVPFIHANGAEFVEAFVGVGAARVRDIFRKARQHKPCLIFIDEIDAIGAKRGAGGDPSRSSAEKEQTLNQLLTEMNGFGEDGGVLVVAATNRPDALDGALTRPGRFDRKIEIGLPDVRGREQILQAHAANKRLADSVDLRSMACRTTGFSGAGLASLMNEAAILAARRRNGCVTPEDVDDAFERVALGIASGAPVQGESKRAIAYHEAGHALVGTLLPDHDHVYKTTILPSGSHRGLTSFLSTEDPSLLSQTALRAQIARTLAGRAAELLVLGSQGVTSGAADDLRQVDGLARSMVTRFGMSELGTTSIGDGGYSDRMAEAVDRAIQQICEEGFQEALLLLAEHRLTLDAVARELAEHETLSGSRVREMVSADVVVPERTNVA